MCDFNFFLAAHSSETALSVEQEWYKAHIKEGEMRRNDRGKAKSLCARPTNMRKDNIENVLQETRSVRCGSHSG
jgi:hypothetical protein